MGGRLVVESPAGGVAVVAVQAGTAVASKVEVGFGGVFGTIQQFALEMTTSFAIARSLDIAFELTIAAFVLFHVG